MRSKGLLNSPWPKCTFSCDSIWFPVYRTLLLTRPFQGWYEHSEYHELQVAESKLHVVAMNYWEISQPASPRIYPHTLRVRDVEVKSRAKYAQDNIIGSPFLSMYLSSQHHCHLLGISK